jgi:integrase
VKIGDLAAGRGRLKTPKPSGPLAGLVEEWIKVRRTTHRAADQDENRWNNHLAPFLGRYSPDDIDVALLKRIVAAKLGEGLSPATVRLLMRLVSTLYSDLIDEGKATKSARPPSVSSVRRHLAQAANSSASTEMTGFIKNACKKLKLPELTFYEAGRHTFASQWVLNGGSIEKVREILGHSTVLVTERYAHLKPELFEGADLVRADVSLHAAT